MLPEISHSLLKVLNLCGVFFLVSALLQALQALVFPICRYKLIVVIHLGDNCFNGIDMCFQIGNLVRVVIFVFAVKHKARKLGVRCVSLSLQSGRKEAVASALETMGEIVKEGKAGGGELSEGFMVEFRDYAQKVLDEGFDISELAKWGKESGIDIGDVFQDDFKDIVQRQIDKGFDIKDLIVWGTNSGLTIGDNYDKEFEKLVQKALDEMYPDTSGLVQWAIDNGTALGEIFGENYSQHLSEYMREVELAYWKRWDEVGVQSINSASDAAKYYADDYGIGSKSNLRYFAKGGFLGSGQGIVAEAGPELIEIMNGGARITPLTGTARNTAVSGAGGSGVQKNFYSSYTVNATIAGKYDVTRLAEDLEMERRRIEAGRGL